MTPSDPSPDPHRRGQEKSAERAPFIRQLDRVAGEINPLLVIFMIGLGILDLTCYVGIEMTQGQHARGAAVTSAAYRR
jgi:hypothetical protein